MQVIRRKNTGHSFTRVRVSEKFSEQEPMHPDDYQAHLAWVTARRVHENLLKNTVAGERVARWITG
jgi:hypothetical protein